MVSGRTDVSKQQHANAGSNAEPAEDLDAEDFADADEVPDEDYHRPRNLRYPGQLPPTIKNKLLATAMLVARALKLPFERGACVAPFSAVAAAGHVNVVVYTKGQGWRAQLTTGLLGFDRVHAWADHADPCKALAALVPLAQQIQTKRKERTTCPK